MDSNSLSRWNRWLNMSDVEKDSAIEVHLKTGMTREQLILIFGKTNPKIIFRIWKVRHEDGSEEFRGDCSIHPESLKLVEQEAIKYGYKIKR